MDVRLTTERLLLRPFTASPADVDLLVDLDSDPEVMRFLTGGVPTPRAEVAERVLPRMLAVGERRPGYGFWAAHERDGGAFAGWFTLRPHHERGTSDVELGYRLRRAVWGRGYATEMGRALLREAFEVLGTPRVYAETMAVNVRSRRVLARLGLRFVRTFHFDWPHPIAGAEHGEVEYALTRADRAGAEALVRELRAGGDLPAQWADALRATPRGHFLPDRVWVDEGPPRGPVHCVAVDRAEDPARWAGAVYTNRVVVTQYDDGATEWPAVGRRATCSSSMPEVMVGMLAALDVRPEHHVLEIGTGTGFNAALLAARARRVTTVEVDAGIAEQARATLAGHLGVTVVHGDGTAGWPASAPYQRVIATAGVPLGGLPYAWVAQAEPGAVIVAPVRADLAAGPLVRFVVAADGTATGRVLPMRVAFMELRGHRVALPDDESVTGAAPPEATGLDPWAVLQDEAARWAVAVALPRCSFDLREPRGARLVDPGSGSWALVLPADAGFEVRQHGPRRLWDELVTAYDWWLAAGRPAMDDWTLHVTPTAQTATVGPS
ncbi:MAG TPA: GNAT family N-acetyltransferase [Pseudonocardiaceae bacterium]